MNPMSGRTDLQGRVAVVVGGASGVGAAIVRDLSEAGATVIVADLHPPHGHRPVDITSAESIDHLAKRIADTHGTCDYLVNCAGAVAVGPVTSLSEADFDRVYAVNVKGLWMTVRALIPLMGQGGSILNVASGAGLRPLPELSVYASSKAAVIGLSRAMAGELAGEGIRVNCLCPGLVDTPLARSTQNDRSSAAADQAGNFDNYMIRRYGTPEELSDAALMLLTNEYITGSTLAVDGGRTLH